LADVNQSGFMEYPQVPRDARARDRKRVGEFAGTGWVVAEDLEQGTAAAVCQGVQHGVHRRKAYLTGYVTARVRCRGGSLGIAQTTLSERALHEPAATAGFNDACAVGRGGEGRLY
jgi:hypothetical protein